MCIGSNLSKGQSRDPDKARRYLGLLDAARSDGKWPEVPELARKVEKHAPQRKCSLAGPPLIQIQRTKACVLSTFTDQLTPRSRPHSPVRMPDSVSVVQDPLRCLHCRRWQPPEAGTTLTRGR